MFKRLKSLFETPASPTASNRFDDVQIAAAALLVSAARMDADFGEAERTRIHQILQKAHDLGAAETNELMELGAKEEGEAVDLFGWTRTLKDAYGEAERIRLIEQLWETVYADGVLNDYEASLLRRIAGLIYVPDRETGLARQRVLARLGLTG
ncbi:MAG: TerB family tellurite resistance protein [Parvibaculum sp.]